MGRADGVPSAKADFRELGEKTPLTTVISQQWMGSDQFVKRMIDDALNKQIGNQALSKEAAEKFGFTCPQDVLSCFYRGVVTARFTNVPAENAARSAEKVEFEVKVVQTQPSAVSVRMTRTPFNGAN